MKSIKKIILSMICLSLVILSVSCKNKDGKTNTSEASKVENNELLIGAAASLTDAFNEIKPIFEEKENCKLNFNFAASGTLQKQVEEDGGLDVFVSASEDKMNKLIEQDLIIKDTVFPVLKNGLVLITNKDMKESINMENFVDISNKIAIGQPDVVPAGQYAKQTLENKDIWDKVEGKLVFAKDVRAVLAYVSSGECEAGFVYKSDAIIDENVKIAEEVGEDLHDPIVYPGGVVKSSKAVKLSQKFLDFLKEDESKEILKKYGFLVND
ncbi:molybdate ABC transporter substrate-binding protein [Lagierella sp.]|uniref:molybdate ABC transporter substrate-binding protein n=1 Tax=Lagierella sp. TaxID=2849657 RepID=UPI0026121599|nr:molybdate ABC transporter substrate-binding protein [Lagierella sp.]